MGRLIGDVSMSLWPSDLRLKGKPGSVCLAPLLIVIIPISWIIVITHVLLKCVCMYMWRWLLTSVANAKQAASTLYSDSNVSAGLSHLYHYKQRALALYLLILTPSEECLTHVEWCLLHAFPIGLTCLKVDNDNELCSHRNFCDFTCGKVNYLLHDISHDSEFKHNVTPFVN